MLDKIEKLNLFLIPLDQNRKWYRYHHFFSDMLYARLQSKHEDKLLQLHHKASIWYLENNFIDEAIFHATASKDYELVASIIAKEGVKPVLQGQFSTLDNWLKTLPEKTILEHPQLSIYKAIVGFFVHASFEQLKSYMALAEQRLIFLSKKNDSTDIDLQDETLRELFGQIFLIKAMVTGTENKISEAKQFIQKALDYLPDENSAFKLLSSLVLLVCIFLGEKIENVEVNVKKASYLCRIQKNVFFEFYLIIIRSILEITRGKLNSADEIITNALEQNKNRLNDESHFSDPAGILLIMKGEICREQGLFDQAEEFLLQGIKLSTHIVAPNFIAFAYICLSKVMASKKNIEDAMAIIAKAEEYSWPINNYLSYSLEPCRAQLQILSGDLNLVKRWVKQSKLDDIKK